MSKAKKVGLIVCLGILFALTAASRAGAADWAFYGMNKNIGKMYYDQGNITRVGQDVVRVWTKIIYNQNGKEKAAKFLQGIHEARDSERVSHELTWLEMNCSTKKIKAVSTTFYTKDGDPVFSTMRSSRDEWEEIVPESVADRLKNEVCPR